MAATVRACARLRVPVVTRGAGTGLSGGANAVDGCVVLDLSRMNRVLEIDEDDLVAVVEPGVVNDDLKAAVAEHGLWYPPDPASSPWSTIGGNVATNAGGLCCVKYGVTRDYVLALEVVTARRYERGAAEAPRAGEPSHWDGVVKGAIMTGQLVRAAAGDTYDHLGLRLRMCLTGQETGGGLAVVEHVGRRGTGTPLHRTPVRPRPSSSSTATSTVGRTRTTPS